MADTINLINAAISLQASGTQELRAESSSDSAAGRGFDRFFDVTLIGSCLFTFTAVARARLQRMTVRFRQDATGGRVIVLPANITWAGKITPTLTQVPGDFDEVEFRTYDGGSSWMALLITQGTRASGYGFSLFKDLASKVVPAVVLAFSSLGFSTAGIGAAMYVDAGQQALPAAGKGLWWDVDQLGRQFKLASGEQVTPAKFGALPQSVSTADQSPKINAAINYVQTVVGKGTVDLEGYFYTCSNTVRPNPAYCSLTGRSARLDFSTFVAQDPDAQPNLMPWSSSSWGRGTLTPRGNEWVLDTSAGKLYRPAISAAQFADFGGQIDAGLRVGDQLRLTVVVNALSAAGPSAIYLNFGLFDRAISQGFSVGGINIANQTITSPTTFTADITIPQTAVHADGTPGFDRGAWLTIQTVCNAEIGSISISRIPNNRLLHVFTDAGSPQYGQTSLPWFGFEIVGPGRFGYAIGIDHECYTNSLSSRILGEWIGVHGCYIGHKWSSHSYTGGYIYSGVYDCTYCVYSTPNSPDAGENISYSHSGIYNSSIGIYNPAGFQFFFVQCSIDYNGSFYRGTSARFDNCHFEMGNPKLYTDPKLGPVGTGRVPFEVTKGTLEISNSMILMTTSFDPAQVNLPCLFSTASVYSNIRLTNVSGYNWNTKSGYLHQGPGRLSSWGTHGGSNLNIPWRLSDDDDHRMTGSAGHFEGSAINLDCWLTSVTGSRGRTSVVTYTGSTTAGTIHGDGSIGAIAAAERCDPGTWRIRFTGTGTFNVLRPDYTIATTGTLTSGAGNTAVINTGGFMATITQGGPNNFTTGDAWNIAVGDQTGKAIYYTDTSGVITGKAQLVLTTADFSKGAKSMELQLTGNAPNGSLVLYMGPPFRPEARGGMAFDWRYISPNANLTGSSTLYFQFYRAKLLHGESGVPQMVEQNFAGESNPTFPQNASTSWATVELSMMNNANDTGLTPYWCNALVMKANLAGLAPLSLVRFDEVEVCAL